MVNVGKKVLKRKIEQIKNKRKRVRGDAIIGGDPNDEPLGKRQSWREEIQDDGPLAEASVAAAGSDSDESLTEMAKANLPPSFDDESEDGVEGTTKKGIPTVPDVDKRAAVVAPNKNSVLSDVTFESLRGKVSDRTLDAVAAMGFVNMTEIQQKTIEPLLEGADVLGSAKTGSGKTLAFLIPAVELLVRSGWRQRDGTGVLIISPTRELSMQTYTVLSELMEKHPNLTHGLVMGGANRDSEARRLSVGVAVLVATPGRLLDHLKNTDGFSVRELKCFIIDEADRIFDVGFEEELHQIVRMLPKRRQTLLFSATHSNKVDDLVRVALHADPMKIGVAEPTDLAASGGQQLATVEGLEQGYVVCPSERRFQLLYTFLRKNKTKKVMVFFSSCAAVQFYNELLNYVDVTVQCIHGKQKQQKRTCTFFSFSKALDGVLLCTDVAARGLDIPAVDWIVQFDPPDEPREYIHRVGRTARGATGTGNALLILRPEELGFLRFLKSARVTLNEYEFAWTKLVDIQPQLEKLIAQNYYLSKSAKEAYKGYIRSYDSHSLKQIYDVNTLDLVQVAKSFGFKAPPFVDLPVANKPKVKPLPTGPIGANGRKRPIGSAGGGGHKTFVKPKMAKRK